MKQSTIRRPFLGLCAFSWIFLSSISLCQVAVTATDPVASFRGQITYRGTYKLQVTVPVSSRERGQQVNLGGVKVTLGKSAKTEEYSGEIIFSAEYASQKMKATFKASKPLNNGEIHDVSVLADNKCETTDEAGSQVFQLQCSASIFSGTIKDITRNNKSPYVLTFQTAAIQVVNYDVGKQQGAIASQQAGAEVQSPPQTQLEQHDIAKSTSVAGACNVEATTRLGTLSIVSAEVVPALSRWVLTYSIRPNTKWFYEIDVDGSNTFIKPVEGGDTVSAQLGIFSEEKVVRYPSNATGIGQYIFHLKKGAPVPNAFSLRLNANISEYKNPKKNDRGEMRNLLTEVYKFSSVPSTCGEQLLAKTRASRLLPTDKEVPCASYSYDWPEGGKFRKWCYSDFSGSNKTEVEATPNEGQKQEWAAKWEQQHRFASGKPTLGDLREMVVTLDTDKGTTKEQRAACLGDTYGLSFPGDTYKDTYLDGHSELRKETSKMVRGYMNQCQFEIAVKCADQKELLRMPPPKGSPIPIGQIFQCSNPVVQ